MTDTPQPRPNDNVFARVTHERWAQQLQRRIGEPGYRDEWSADQCGGCRVWIALCGVLGDDNGRV